jgi:hypothetical protein
MLIGLIIIIVIRQIYRLESNDKKNKITRLEMRFAKMEGITESREVVFSSAID